MIFYYLLCRGWFLVRTGCNSSLKLKSNLFIPDLIFVIVYQLCACMSQETRFFRRVWAYLFMRTVILFIFKHLIRSIPTPATPPHTRAVATHSIPDPVKHLMKPLRYGQWMDVVRVHRKWTRTKPICFTINSGLVSSACPSIRSTTDIPCYCGI